ncbi:hypothetical protein [Kineosporia succinea]|uniref:Uncharacterized protein n=1 Tax=Kineosporia succinea TaxID=84632 RepID=A0ABT9NXR6_9ACTN|nr:hypothetical protein [Kineosporia succinea]MDP9825229.1 hypothetical protein [Kineosporia succinea]
MSWASLGNWITGDEASGWVEAVGTVAAFFAVTWSIRSEARYRRQDQRERLRGQCFNFAASASTSALIFRARESQQAAPGRNVEPIIVELSISGVTGLHALLLPILYSGNQSLSAAASHLFDTFCDLSDAAMTGKSPSAELEFESALSAFRDAIGKL